MQNRHVYAVDLMKFICAILVIVVHTYPFYETFPRIGFVSSNIIGRIIIPFFFISAGYFLEKGLKGKDEDYFKRYIWRLIKLYLLWSLLFLPFGIHLVSGYIELQGIQWFGALLIGIFYSGTYYHLWYMAALIFAILFCHTYLKHFRLKSLFILGIVLFAFGCLETYYGALVEKPILSGIKLYFNLFITTRNGLFFGILYVTLGIGIARYDLDQKIKHPLALSLLFFLLLIIEAFTVRHFQFALDYNMYFMAVPFITFFFSWLLNTNCPFNLNYRDLREYSTLIYFSHGIYLELIPWVLSSHYEGLYQLGWFRFTSVFTLTIITSYVIKHYIPWLK